MVELIFNQFSSLQFRLLCHLLQVKIIALAGLAWMAESMMVNVLGVLGPEIYCRWRLSADAEASISIAGFLGLMLGCVVFGYIFDRYGRRFGMLLSVGWSAVFCLITAFSTRYLFLVINVFFMSFGAGASSLAAVYSCEFIPGILHTRICIDNNIRGLSEIMCQNYLQIVRNWSNLTRMVFFLGFLEKHWYFCMMFFVSLNFVVEWKFQFFTFPLSGHEPTYSIFGSNYSCAKMRMEVISST